MTDWWDRALDVAITEFTRPDYTQNPTAWVTDTLNEHLWSAQARIFDSLRDNRYTAVQSCHDSGKSYAASRAVARWLSVYPPGEAFVVTTAPTAAQVAAILWREIGRAHVKGGLRGKITMSGFPSWKLDSGQLIGYGRKPADYDQSAFQGIHDRYVLVVVDEAGGVEKALFDQVDSIVTNVDARVLAIGNPDDPTSYFARICKPGSGWAVHRIDGLRTPNFTREQVESTRCGLCDSGRPELLVRLMAEEGVPFVEETVPDHVRPLLLSPLWVEERLHRWVGAPGLSPSGEPESLSEKAARSSLFTAKVRGEFPADGSDGVIPLGWVQRAVDRWRDWCFAGKPLLPGRVIVGVDPGRSLAGDETVLYVRQGAGPVCIDAFHTDDTMHTVDRVDAYVDSPEGCAVVDVIGVGAGVVDRLRRLGRGVVAFHAGESAGASRTDRSGKLRFANARAAAWWHMRELLDPSRAGGSEVMLPDDDLLIADLTTPRVVTKGGVTYVEPKDDIRKRLGRSTDRGDACVQAYLVDATPFGAGGGNVFPWNTVRDRAGIRRVSSVAALEEAWAVVPWNPDTGAGVDLVEDWLTM